MDIRVQHRLWIIEEFAVPDNTWTILGGDSLLLTAEGDAEEDRLSAYWAANQRLFVAFCTAALSIFPRMVPRIQMVGFRPDALSSIPWPAIGTLPASGVPFLAPLSVVEVMREIQWLDHNLFNGRFFLSFWAEEIGTAALAAIPEATSANSGPHGLQRLVESNSAFQGMVFYPDEFPEFPKLLAPKLQCDKASAILRAELRAG